MAKFFSELDADLIRFISEQKVFFTASAPAEGRINLSPKGMDTFRCLDSRTVCYLDLTGSGNETSAHLNERDRMTIMFCSFSTQPLILRLYGRGEVIRPRDSRWQDYVRYFTEIPGQRQIFVLRIESVQTSCGYAVPVMEFKEERPALKKWAENKGPEGIQKYWQEKNIRSIDGLPTHLLENQG
ncbi:pyridoxamine 5'-phosphate oxidase family protein [Pedosphaera parvula]|uniref:Pyridoxamine 5'-phosphate oxidase-related FMN-binding n=1 Tax=Pedosphaera parvula (strain Ellin514) TaxID=320771 RepID=B9XJP5_PEDPL|nr:pyridoxamine 5'-phosphate oxidase family protein [Pedosphaera parvula]EEF59921.1 pyridoxamine 5'-phosphate oxidase-related FMN-binding [Pedosphaera parvula Ellin514]